MAKSLIDSWIDSASEKYKLSSESKLLIKKIMKHNTEEIVKNIEKNALKKNYKNYYIGPKLTQEVCSKNLSMPNEFTHTEVREILPKYPEVV